MRESMHDEIIPAAQHFVSFEEHEEEGKVCGSSLETFSNFLLGGGRGGGGGGGDPPDMV
jgi:hypothetical protein